MYRHVFMMIITIVYPRIYQQRGIPLKPYGCAWSSEPVNFTNYPWVSKVYSSIQWSLVTTTALHWGDSNKYPKHMLLYSIKHNILAWFVTNCYLISEGFVTVKMSYKEFCHCIECRYKEDCLYLNIVRTIVLNRGLSQKSKQHDK